MAKKLTTRPSSRFLFCLRMWVPICTTIISVRDLLTNNPFSTRVILYSSLKQLPPYSIPSSHHSRILEKGVQDHLIKEVEKYRGTGERSLPESHGLRTPPEADNSSTTPGWTTYWPPWGRAGKGENEFGTRETPKVAWELRV